jgi:hypothetical protein
MSMMRTTGLIALSLLLAAPLGAATPEESCEIAKNKAAGAYGACRQKAEASAIQKGTTPTYGKCADKFRKSWDKAEAKAAKRGAACVDGLASADLETIVTEHSTLVAALLSSRNVQCLEPYRTLDLANRNVSAPAGLTTYCDDPSGVQDVQWLGAGWYRMRQPAGTQVPETCPFRKPHP